MADQRQKLTTCPYCEEPFDYPRALRDHFPCSEAPTTEDLHQ